MCRCTARCTLVSPRFIRKRILSRKSHIEQLDKLAKLFNATKIARVKIVSLVKVITRSFNYRVENKRPDFEIHIFINSERNAMHEKSAGNFILIYIVISY